MLLVRPTSTQSNIHAEDFLLVVCNYTSHKKLRKPPLPNPLVCEKAEDLAGTMTARKAQKTL